MSQVALPPFRVVNTLEVSGAVYALHAFQGRLLGAVSRPFLNVFFFGGGMKMRYLFVWEWLNEGSELNNCNTCCIISFFLGGGGGGGGWDDFNFHVDFFFGESYKNGPIFSQHISLF